MSPSKPKLKQPVASFKEHRNRASSSSSANKRMSSSPDAPNNEEQYPRPDTTKRRKHGTPVEIMGASNSSFAKPSPGSKESPIDIDEEEVPVWMAQPVSASRRLGRTYGGRLQESRPRKPSVKSDEVVVIPSDGEDESDEPSSNAISLRKGLEKSREAKYLGSSLRSVDLSLDTNTKDGRLLGDSGKSDLDTEFITKKAPSADGSARSALFHHISTTSTVIEDHMTGAATYTNMQTTENPRGRLPALKNLSSAKSKGPPGLKVLPGNSPGHAFTSSTPSLNRTPVRAAGRLSPTLVDYSSSDSSESESDAELPDDLLSSSNNEMVNHDSAKHTPRQPTRVAPSSPPPSYSAVSTNVIELRGADDDTAPLPDQVFAQVSKGFKATQRDQMDDSDTSGGGVPLINPNFGAPLTRVTPNSEKEKEKDSDGDEKMDTPPSQGDESEGEDKDASVPENCVRFEVKEFGNQDHSCFLILSLDTPFHILRIRIAIGLGWTGVSGATFSLHAIRDATGKSKKAEYEIDGDNWSECLDWMGRMTPEDDDTSDIYMVVFNQAAPTPKRMSSKDKEREKDRIDEEMSKFRVPQIFGGDRPKREGDQVVPLDGLPLDRIGGNVVC